MTINDPFSPTRVDPFSPTRVPAITSVTRPVPGTSETMVTIVQMMLHLKTTGGVSPALSATVIAALVQLDKVLVTVGATEDGDMVVFEMGDPNPFVDRRHVVHVTEKEISWTYDHDDANCLHSFTSRTSVDGLAFVLDVIQKAAFEA